jgi:hypothetical protein
MRLLALSALVLVACGDAGDDPSPLPEPDFVPGPAVDTSQPAPEPPPDDSASVQGPLPAGAACKKKITVLFTVGVPGTSKMKSNGCWTPIIADGAANKDFRKCSTSDFVVGNANAPSWAYDDTNPSHTLSQEQSFLSKCSMGATGDGYEYMAYRSGWRFLSAPRLRAYFAELYGSSPTDIASLWYQPGVYVGNAGLAKHKNVYPMMNFGPPAASKLEAKVGSDALKICKTIPDGGYFGMYNPSWRDGMAANDPRLLALEKALDACTTK